MDGHAPTHQSAALVYAVTRSKLQSVQVLLESDTCDIDRLCEDDEGCSWTPLMYAAARPMFMPSARKDICELLLKHGAKVNGVYNSIGLDVIQITRVKNPPFVPLLLEARKAQQSKQK